MKMLNEKWMIVGACILAFANTRAQTNGFKVISDSYTVQKPWNLPVSDRFAVTNGVYTCWVFGTDQPFSQGSGTGPRTEMRWQTWTNQAVPNQFAFDEKFSAGTSHTCVHQIKSDDKGDGSGGEALYLQVNEAGTLRNSVGADFATGIANTWYHINSIYDPATGDAELYYNGSQVATVTGYTYPNGQWYFKTGVYDNGMPTNAEAWVQIKNVVHWINMGGGGFSGYYQIIDRNSGKNANVKGAATTNGAIVQLYTTGTAANEEWTLTPTDSGYYQIVNRNSGKVMAVQGASTADGAAVIQWSFGSSQNDQWKPVSISGGYYNLVNRHSGLLLDVKGAGTTNGTPFEQYHSTGGNNQQFQLNSVN